MNVLKRCCIRSLKENRKRTVVTIIGVILATALITGVACLAESLRQSLIFYEKESEGDYHYRFSNVAGEDLKYYQNNVNLERLGLAVEIGYAVLEGSENPDKPYLYIRGADEEGIQSMALKLVEGRMPEREGELVISRHITYNGMVALHVGDILNLQVGSRMSDGYSLGQSNGYTYDEEGLENLAEKTYTIVGVVERPSLGVEPRIAPGYSVFTYMDTENLPETSNYEVYAAYTRRGLKHADQVTAGLLGMSEDLFRRYFRPTGGGWTVEEFDQIEKLISKVQENRDLIRWETLPLSNSTINALYGMAALAVVIIIVTSIFCIRNSFVISLTEKMKLYGRLASVGTTSKQQRRMVYYEAAFFGMVGIPLGILSGLSASVILVRGVSGLVETAMDIPLVFAISVPVVLLAVVLSAVTILLSAMNSARQAARISPVNAIRAISSIKLNRQELKCPRFISGIFGIGGRIAYRNLRRARRRYRTTVVSIVVSVAVFVGLTTFVQLLGIATGMYYTNLPYQLRVYVGILDDQGRENAQRIARLAEVQQVEIQRRVLVDADTGLLPLKEGYRRKFLGGNPGEEYGNMSLHIYALGQEGYADYCKSIGVDVTEAQDRAIVIAEYHTHTFQNGKHYDEKGLVAEFEGGEVVNVSREDPETGEVSEAELEVLVQTDVLPMSLTNVSFNTIALIVSDKWLDDSPFSANANRGVVMYIRCGDAGRVEQIIRSELSLGAMTLDNYDAGYRSERAAYLVISIFLYGFITVVALIGITNIFNTITTNLELRAPEFAMLRAVGMTDREFRRMIWLEGLFYGGKALLIGLPLGLVISVGFHMIFSEGVVTEYQPPFLGIGLSAAAVAVLLYGIMHYSMNKIKRKNIVETIQNENL